MHKGKDMGMRSVSTPTPRAHSVRKAPMEEGMRVDGVSGPCLVRNGQKKANFWYYLQSELQA